MILPATPLWSVDEFMKAFGGRRCGDRFRYSSGTNSEWLSVDDLRRLVREHVDPAFTVTV